MGGNEVTVVDGRPVRSVTAGDLTTVPQVVMVPNMGASSRDDVATTPKGQPAGN
jgi:hypothetical protein